jgi:hypothetical protein
LYRADDDGAVYHNDGGRYEDTEQQEVNPIKNFVLDFHHFVLSIVGSDAQQSKINNRFCLALLCVLAASQTLQSFHP